MMGEQIKISSMEERLIQWDASEKILFGTANLTGSTRLAEMAGSIGFDMVWIEMEHGIAGYEKMESLAMATVAGGAVPVARISGFQRDQVLRTLEAGIRVVVVPMINTGAMAEALVQNGKFPPLGSRGFNTSSRGLRYGLHPFVENFEWANRSTHLIGQVETTEAVENLDDILAVDGLSGLLVGPGDLSVSLGCTADFDNPVLRDMITSIIRKTRDAGKHAGIMAASMSVIKTAYDAGADFLFCASDIGNLRGDWQKTLRFAHGGFQE